MYPIINIGPLTLQTSPFILLLGLWIGLYISGYYAGNFQIQEKSLNNLILITLISGFIGARAYYVFNYWEIFINSPTSVFSPNPALFDSVSGIAVGLITALIYAGNNKLNYLNTLDALTPLLAIMAVFYPLAQFSKGAAFGIPTRMPWGIELWGEYRHPVQLYNFFISLIILIMLWPGWKFIKLMHPGKYFLTFLIFTSAYHIFTEGYRGVVYILPGGIRAGQVVFWIILACALILNQRLNNVENPNSRS